MFNWEKLGKIFDPRDHRYCGWMKEFAQSPSVIVFEEYVRVFFCTRPSPTNDGNYLSFLSFIDLDRSDLRKVIKICSSPPLALGDYGTFDEFGTNPISVIQCENEIWVYYAGWTRCESVPFNGAIGLAVSKDNGVNFTRIGRGPVLSYSPDEPFLIGSPRVRKLQDKWYLWYVAGKEWIKGKERPEPIYKIRMATSEDGINWTKQGEDLIPDKLGANECQACPDVIEKEGRYHMFYSYRYSHDYKGAKNGYRIGYATSSDLMKWTRQDELAGMKLSKEGWDSEMVNYPHVFAVDDTTYMLYQGNEMGRSGIGLARLINSKNWS